MTANAIELENVCKSFADKRAVWDVSLAIASGSLTGFLGPNGAGKTTTIRMIMAILFPDSGNIRVLDHASASHARDRIGYLPEERGVYRKMKVAAFLTHIARIKGVSSHGLQHRVSDWLDRIQLGEYARKRCEELSKGMQQKVQLAATLIHEPELIILDEPFSGLDPVNQVLMRELIHEQHRAGRTILFSTHVMAQAEQLCDRLVMLNHGTVVLDATPQQIQSRFDPRTLLVEPIGDVDVAAFEGDGVEHVHKGARECVLKLRDGIDAQVVMQRLVNTVACRRIEMKRPSLEEVFIELAGSARQDSMGKVVGEVSS